MIQVVVYFFSKAIVFEQLKRRASSTFLTTPRLQKSFCANLRVSVLHGFINVFGCLMQFLLTSHTVSQKGQVECYVNHI